MNRNFTLFLIATLCTNLGNGIQIITAAYTTFKISNSTVAVALLFSIVALPQIFASLIAGHLADRFNKKWLSVICDIGSASIVLLLAIMGWIATDGIPLIVLYCASFVLAIIELIFTPINNSLMNEIGDPDQKIHLSAFFEAAAQSGLFLSAFFGGLIVAAMGSYAAFAFNALSFLCSAMLIAALRFHSRSVSAERIEKSTIKYRDIISSSNDYLYISLLYSLGKVVVIITNTLLVVLVIKYQGNEVSVLGMVDAMAGLGVVLASLAFAWLAKRLSLLHVAILGYLGCSFFIVLEPQGGALWLMGFLTCGAFFFGTGRIASRIIVLQRVGDGSAGHLFGLSNALGLGIGVFSVVGISWLTEKISVPFGFYCMSLILVIGTLFCAYHIQRLKRRNDMKSASVTVLDKDSKKPSNPSSTHTL